MKRGRDRQERDDMIKKDGRVGGGREVTKMEGRIRERERGCRVRQDAGLSDLSLNS